jgi:hypothetical protein
MTLVIDFLGEVMQVYKDVYADLIFIGAKLAATFSLEVTFGSLNHCMPKAKPIKEHI